MEDCRKEWRIVGKSEGLKERVEDCWKEWRIVGKRNRRIVGKSGGLQRVEDVGKSGGL